ncbi:Aste57867_8322 [Aphanomyces stellatus]|uniref:subtilisin n=1 Tax=Aphanomyces stellatus TaxID=120398 RepID=A0A485KJZ9_9STRA|nr:hypothetical protein As57867_008290 [Aphanomyces stellatus]VFT85209.1 Aste57867_8322 [Aphanomyces stellatus]
MVSVRALSALAAAIASATSISKISPDLARQLEAGATAFDVVIQFKQPDTVAIIPADLLSLPRGQRLRAVNLALESQAAVVQDGVKALFDSQRAASSIRFYSVQPIAFADGVSLDMVTRIAQDPNVDSIYAPLVGSINPVTVGDETNTKDDSPSEWGVDKIGAPSLWAKGTTGQDVVVANIDTGVRYTHEALAENWRTEFGWLDAVGNSTTPVDYMGHGSHCMGSIAGSHGLGVAPGAQWVACASCNAQGQCPQEAIIKCAQFLLCPTNAAGDKDCTKAPHVISNSYGFNPQTLTWFDATIAAWRAAGIVPVFSNGNEGTRCNSLRYPATSSLVLSVGATDDQDALAGFSSRGPTLDNRVKPDITAPGVNIHSVDFKGDALYRDMSGTSMAGPHVAGAVALYLSANQDATFDQVYDALTTSAESEGVATTGQTCGSIPDIQFPNNNFGFGRLDIFKAVSGGGGGDEA